MRAKSCKGLGSLSFSRIGVRPTTGQIRQVWSSSHTIGTQALSDGIIACCESGGPPIEQINPIAAAWKTRQAKLRRGGIGTSRQPGNPSPALMQSRTPPGAEPLFRSRRYELRRTVATKVSTVGSAPAADAANSNRRFATTFWNICLGHRASARRRTVLFAVRTYLARVRYDPLFFNRITIS